MTKTRELTEIERAEIVGASKLGNSVVEIAKTQINGSKNITSYGQQ